MIPVTAEMKPFRPYGCALELFYCKAPEVLVSGPAGTGKSRACLEKLHACAEKYEGMRALIVRKTRASLTEAALVTYEEKVLPVGHEALTNIQRRNRQVYSYPNGSEIVVGGLDNAQRIMSTEYDMVYVQEAIEATEDDWEKLTTRLRNGTMPYQQILADTNPDVPFHWLKQRCEAGTTTLFESRHEDNPTLWDGSDWTPGGSFYIQTLDRLTGARKLRLRYGRWVQAEGVVYEGWDSSLHVIDRREIPAEWPRYWTVDFGYKNPFVWQAWATDNDGRLYRYREIYFTQRLVEDHARKILEVTAGEPKPQAIICDHDAEDRATLERHLRIPTIAAKKSISPGIQAVQVRLQKAGDGKPRIFYLRDSLVEVDKELHAQKFPVCTEQEFEVYVWPQAADGKPIKEVPVDLHNHGMDATRYMVAQFDLRRKRPEMQVVDYINGNPRREYD
jgi:PBSX family phage terminase large subunit